MNSHDLETAAIRKTTLGSKVDVFFMCFSSERKIYTKGRENNAIALKIKMIAVLGTSFKPKQLYCAAFVNIVTNVKLILACRCSEEF